jgi:hypothetical protein
MLPRIGQTHLRWPPFIVRDANRQALAYVYSEEEPGGAQRRSCSPATTPRRIVAKLPELQITLSADYYKHGLALK